MKKILFCMTLMTSVLTFANAMETLDITNPGEAHCPNKANFRKIVKEHIDDIKNKREFQFEDNGTTWEASRINVHEPEKLEKLSELRILYQTFPNNKSFCLAQFGDSGRNSFTITLNKNAFQYLKQQVGELALAKGGTHLDKLISLLESPAFTAMEQKYKKEANDYRGIVNSVTRAWVSPEVKQKIAQILLQKTIATLGDVVNHKAEASFPGLLNDQFNKLILKEEQKYKEKQKKQPKAEKEKTPKKEREIKTSKEKLKEEDNPFEKLGQEAQTLLTNNKGTRLEQLHALLELPAFTGMEKKYENAVGEYRKIVDAVESAKVSTPVKQALAKKLLQMTSESLANKSETNFPELLNKKFNKLIEKEEQKNTKEGIFKTSNSGEIEHSTFVRDFTKAYDEGDVVTLERLKREKLKGTGWGNIDDLGGKFRKYGPGQDNWNQLIEDAKKNKK